MNITIWFMSSILIHMTYFCFYTICISEHYRAIFGYIPTPDQQISSILCNITITVGFQSQIDCVTYYFVFMLENVTSQKYRKILPGHYFVIPGASF